MPIKIIRDNFYATYSFKLFEKLKFKKHYLFISLYFIISSHKMKKGSFYVSPLFSTCKYINYLR